MFSASDRRTNDIAKALFLKRYILAGKVLHIHVYIEVFIFGSFQSSWLIVSHIRTNLSLAYTCTLVIAYNNARSERL